MTISLFWALNLRAMVCFCQVGSFGPVREAIAAGNSTDLARYLAPKLELMIESKANSYSKSQAEIVLRDFFKQHPPKKIILDLRKSPGEPEPFAVGEYVSEKGTYRVYIKFKREEKQTFVSEIKFFP